MRSRSPDSRYRAVLAAVKQKTLPIDDRERALYALVRKEPSGDPAVAYALDIYMSEYQRETLQGWIAAGATNAELFTCLGIPEEAANAYRHLFFDLTAFRDHLELLDWVNHYEGTPHGVTVLRNAVMNGVPGMMWQYNRGNISMDPKAVIGYAMIDAHFRSRAGRMSSLGSTEANASHQFMKTALNAAGALAKGDTGNLLQDLLIKLQHRELTSPVTPEQAEELLH